MLSEDGWSLTVDGAAETCSVLVGADGVRSTARRLLCAEDAAATPLGVFVVLGFCSTPFDYAADCFEAVDGTVRIYTMPFDATRTMWQLSWRGEGPTGGDGEALREAALAHVSAWPGCPDGAAHRGDGARRRDWLSDRRSRTAWSLAGAILCGSQPMCRVHR